MKTIILYGIMLFLLLPILQQVLRIDIRSNSIPLSGAFTLPTDTVLTFDTWLTGDYQTKKQDFITQSGFPFHNLYVRINNQLDFSLFNLSNADWTIVGKKGFFYEIQYINSYNGNNFAGKEFLTEKFEKLKQLQELLRAQGVLLEIIFAPSKTSFYPEYIPDELIIGKKLSNYEFSVSLCNKLGIDYIDFSAWFIHQKDTMTYHLYPQTGTHWSNYGSLIAADSLMKRIAKQTRLKLRNIIIDSVSFSNRLQGADQDLADLSNLLINPKHFIMPYATYHFSTGEKLKTLVIGDSYFTNISSQGLADSLFADWSFWFYNKKIFPEKTPVPVNILPEIKKHKVVILMVTESNLVDFGWGFIEKAYSELTGVASSKAVHNKL